MKDTNEEINCGINNATDYNLQQMREKRPMEDPVYDDDNDDDKKNPPPLLHPKNQRSHIKIAMTIALVLVVSAAVITGIVVGVENHKESSNDKTTNKRNNNDTELPPSSILPWQLLSSPIQGQQAVDNMFGNSVALSADGYRLVVGVPFHGDNGRALVFEWKSDIEEWQQIGLNLVGEARWDYFGQSVAISSDGNRIAIGAHLNDGDDGDGNTTRQNSGHARIFQWNMTMDAWDQMGSDLNGQDAEDRFGFKVALSSNGDRIAVGAPHYQGIGADAGYVQAYDWQIDSDGEWSQVGQDVIAEVAGDLFGSTVALSSDGKRMAVGAFYNDGDNGSDSGHVRIFEWMTSFGWHQLGPDLDGELAGDQFGMSLALSGNGNRVVIGAPGSVGSGKVRIFDWMGTQWEKVGADLLGDPRNDGFGFSVSISGSGDRVAVGDPYHDGDDQQQMVDSGHVTVFDWSGTAWQSNVVWKGETNLEWLGWSVTLSSNGRRLAMGSPSFHDDPHYGHDRSGYVRVFEEELE